MKNFLKLTGSILGVAAVAGTTAYVLTQTEKGRKLTVHTKKRVAKLKESFCDQLEIYQVSLQKDSLVKTPLVFQDFEDDFVEEEGLEMLSIESLLNSELKARPIRLICNSPVLALYEQGLDADAIAETLNLSFESVLKDLIEGQKADA